MDLFTTHASNNPDKTALLQDDRVVTWREFVEMRNRLANSMLERGVRPGEHIAVYSQNAIEVLVAGAAISVLGGISIPVNHRLVADEVAYVLDNSDAAAVFVGDSFLPKVEEVRAAASKVGNWILIGAQRREWADHINDLIENGSPEQPELGAEVTGASMIYTAGTTGKPKGALRSRIDPGIVAGWIRELGILDGGNVHLVAGPLYHSAPLAFSGFTQAVGGTNVIMGKFDAEQALELIEKHRCASSFMAPTLLKRIVDLPDATKKRYDPSSMKSLIVAGAPCPMKVKEDALAYFGPVLYEFYGSTELGIDTILKPEDVLRKPGSCGKAAPGIEIAILDEDGKPAAPGAPGELHVRRFSGMFDQYYKNPEATKEAARGDWVSVGDVAYTDEEGFVFICDRKRDMIISGGVNIYPAEIEDKLHRHPKILDVAVFGVPDDEWGERVHAAVEIRPGDKLTEEEVTAFAREQMADYKIPREVSFHRDLPRDAAGKLVKRILREPFWKDRGSKV